FREQEHQRLLSCNKYHGWECRADWLAPPGRLADRYPQPGRRIFLLCPSFFLRAGFRRGRSGKGRRSTGVYGGQRVWTSGNYRTVSPSSSSGDLCKDRRRGRACFESISGTAVLTGKAEKFFLLKRKKICYTLEIY